MSLTQDDLQAIRDVFNDGIEQLILLRLDALETRMDGLETHMGGLEDRMAGQERATRSLQTEVAQLNRQVLSLEQKIDQLAGRVTALEADVKELYGIAGTQWPAKARERQGATAGMTLEEKFRALYKDFQATAKEAGITLPK